MKGKQRSKSEGERDQESVTSTSSRSLLGKGDLREKLGHQNNTLRGERARPLLQPGVFKHPVVGKGRLEGDGH
jgi:hypothetical protein